MQRTRSARASLATVARVGQRARIHFPGAFHHVSARGNNGERTYVDATDAEVFTTLLARSVSRYGWLCLAYCLMSNHYHLVLVTPQDGLSKGIQELNGDYARQFNRRHGREGHLFRNRFWSVPLESESHLLAACGYVVLNPVRARLCDRPEDWPWSSYRASAGFDFAPPFLAERELLSYFGSRPDAARRAYREFVEAGMVSDAVTEVSPARVSDPGSSGRGVPSAVLPRAR